VAAQPSPLTVAVTGASRGIGRATALAFAARGHKVFALARSLPDLQALAEDQGRSSGTIIPLEMDVADEPSRQQAVAAILEHTSGYGLDVLVNNAGYGQFGPLEEVTPEQLRCQIEVNLIGVLAFTQPFLPMMRSRRRGRIINVSSVAGRVATPFMGAYNASKFALEGMSDALRLELSPFSIKVVLIEPGPVRSNFGEAVQETVSTDSPYARFQRRWRGTRGASDFFSRSADHCAAVIVRAALSPHPRVRYRVTPHALLAEIGRRLVPDRVTDFAIRVASGLWMLTP
jgi:NAD(P)-dependent dehydrogenase (short-subunit alcohol dehydrogenase family)